jgi:hypothetical protein
MSAVPLLKTEAHKKWAAFLRCVDGDQSPAKVRQSRVHIVSVDSDDIVGRVAGHILVHHSEDVDSRAGVGLHDIPAAEKTALLAAVEVEFERVAWREAGAGEDTESLEENDDALDGIICVRTQSVSHSEENGFALTLALSSAPGARPDVELPMLS